MTENHADRAERLFREGANCAQAVFGAFAGDLGLTKEQAFRYASAFGGGMGRMREVCGAFSGLLLVLSFRAGYSDVSDPEIKKNYYALIQSLGADFRSEAGALVCRELMPGAETGGVPQERTPEFYEKRPCVSVIRLAARLGEEKVLTLRT